MKGLKKEPKASQELGLLSVGGEGLHGSLPSSCSFEEDFHHLTGTPHSYCALTRNSSTNKCFSKAVPCAETALVIRFLFSFAYAQRELWAREGGGPISLPGCAA